MIYDNKMIKEENIIFVKGVLHFSNNKNDVNLLFTYKVKYQNKIETYLKKVDYDMATYNV